MSAPVIYHKAIFKDGKDKKFQMFFRAQTGSATMDAEQLKAVKIVGEKNHLMFVRVEEKK